MTDSGLGSLLIETGRYLTPLQRAVADPGQLTDFLGRFGYQPDEDQLDAGFETLGGLRDTFDDLRDAISALPPFDEVGAADLAVLAAPIGSAVRQIRDIATAGSGLVDLIEVDTFPAEVFDLLLHDHLRSRIPMANDLLRAFGVLETIDLPAEPDGRDIDVTLVRFQWSRLRTMIDGDGEWATDVYGWGEAFDPDLAIVRIVAVLDWLGPYAQIAPMTEQQLEAGIVTGHPDDEPPPRHAVAPLLGTDLDELDVSSPAGLDAMVEAGLLLLPFGDLASPDQLGLALAPYAKGSVSGSHQVAEAITLLLDIEASAVGGRVLALDPDGLHVVGVGDASASFELGLRYADPDGQPIVLIGSADGTRLQIDAALVSVGGAMDGDLFVAGGGEQLRAVIDLSEDGFLGSLVSDPITVEVGDVLAGWRPGRGLYLEGGTRLAMLIPVDIDLGPLHLQELELELDIAGPVSLALTVTASATLGPLFAHVEGLGLRAALVPAEDDEGVLGSFDVVLSLVPPSGYAIGLDAAPISGGGLLARTDDGYRGALALDLGNIAFSAFAVLSTDAPDQDVSFSFIASIFGEFTLPLGFGFFLTGVGGIVGLHRTVDTDALREVLYEGRLDDQLFPADPIANADTILDDMAAIFPVAAGRHLFGPVARVSWGQPALIDGKLGVIVEVGDGPRILILGALSSALPTRDAALVELHLAFFGEIDFAAETIEFDATLANSRILLYGISGEMALRTGWGTGLDHVVSFGGLHPDFPRPDNLPNLQRLTIAFGKDNPKVSLRAYLGVTLNSLQFGARLTVFFEGPKVPFVGQLAVEGNIYFDALLTFNPFAFDVSLGGSLELLVDGSPKLEVGFELRLRGPNRFKIDGKAWARVFRVDVSVPISHGWGDAQTLPAVTTDPAEILLDALTTGEGFRGIGTTARSSGVTFRSLEEGEQQPADPAGGLRLHQRAVPLDTAIDKVGEAAVDQGPASFDLQLTDDTGLHVRDVELDFARGQYFDLSEAERLRTPSFERRKAGIELSPDELLVDTDAAIEATHDYEVVVIAGDDDDRTSSRVATIGYLSSAFMARWSNNGIASIATPDVRARRRAADAITLDTKVEADTVAADTVAANLIHGQPRHADYVMAAAAAGVGR